MKHRAYSYIRFSTADQLKGKSLERQTEGAAAWCKQHGIELDTELTLQDLGVSAFRGKNADTGALGVFLRAVHIGQVPKGSFLLIETFDRMSRENAYDAQLTLQNIINAGITVVTLMDNKQYNVAILRADPLALIYAILLMSRSHEESATKSKRLCDAWRRKRDNISKGVMLTAMTPAWIKLDRGKFKLLPEKAKVLELIFALYIKGSGCVAIAKKLNQTQSPTFGNAAFWSSNLVRKYLCSRAVIGEFQPHREDRSTHRRKRVASGEPIKDYFPAAIKPAVFKRAEQIHEQVVRVPRVSAKFKLRNMLAGVAYCPHCDSIMTRSTKRDDASARLVCLRSRAGGGCKYKSVKLATLEDALMSNAATLATQIPTTDSSWQTELEETERDLKLNELEISDLAMLLDGTPSRVVAAKIAAAEAEQEKLRLRLEALQLQAQYRNTKRIKDSAARMREALQWHAQAKDDANLPSINESLRECFSKILVDVDSRQMRMHWKHGGETTLPY